MDIESILDEFSDDILMESLIYNPMELFYERVREKEITHSEILVDLLNPKGEHGLGDVFLKSFLEYIDAGLNTDVCVLKEKPISRVLTSGKGDRRIDILIQWEDGREKKAVIIENKLNNAEEQELQLRDYKKGLENEDVEVIKTVCLQGSACHNIGADIDISPSELAQILSVNTPNLNNVSSYISLLYNMDRNTKSKELAEELFRKDDETIRKVRELLFSFKDNICNVCFENIWKRLQSDYNCDFRESGEYEHKIKSQHLNLWNKESYLNGSNKGYWIEVYFYDYSRFEVWINCDDTKTSELNLEYYVHDSKYPGFYRDKDGVKAFEFPSSSQFNMLLKYLSKLLHDL